MHTKYKYYNAFYKFQKGYYYGSIKWHIKIKHLVRLELIVLKHNYPIFY